MVRGGGGVYIAGGAWQGDVRGRGCVRCWGHAWWGCALAGVCVVLGACMVGGMCGRGHAWQGTCMTGGVNERAVHILLEYILVITFAES